MSLSMSLPNLNSDILLEIVRELKDNRGSLFNFLFANKFFCEIAVSVLWSNPFRYKVGSYSIIQTYIKLFNEEEQNEIKETLDKSFKFNNEREKQLHFQYGKYLKVFKLEEIKNAIKSWCIRLKNRQRDYDIDYEKYIMKSIMRQCQTLDCLELNVIYVNEDLLKIMQDKIKDLKYFVVHYSKYGNENQNIFGYLKNHSKNISSLIIENMCDDEIAKKELISFIELQNDLDEFILNHMKKNYEYKNLITSTLEFQANNLTKVIIIEVDFSDISFDIIDKCINLKLLVLRSNKGLKSNEMDLYTSFKNLKVLDLSYNDWPSEVTILIIKKAGKSLTSLTIGENNIKQAINDNTLTALAESCPNIYSLSISKTSRESIEMVLSYLKYLKLITLQLFQIENKGTVMKSKVLLDYIKNENSLFKLGLGKNDKYWDSYNNVRKNFEKFLKEHNVRIIAYKPKYKIRL
ncbi:hypothetical protein RhiirA1_467924 [Rhizophagus irregularis]|uniref:F-box domain-containing protein n=1 Tax=Rhizophagus irregularis TaxID=588596 RepID=A0A2N0RB16_9GLOM|nr:hypothetical protein RhiirA1_467924 [Rhizophagus irregularis]